MTVSDNERDDEPANGAENEEVSSNETGDETAAESNDGDFAAEEPVDEAAQLDLGDEGAALPWLEGDDEEEFEAHNSGQLIALLLLGLLAVLLVVGGIWWMTREKTDPELVADGSVIEAPDTPYKEKPEDPGGKTFDGTGDTSFAVSQGETRPARLGEATPAPKPGFETVGKDSESAAGDKPKPDATPAAADSGRVGVQVAAYSTRKSAEAGWNTLSGQYPALSGMRYRIVEGQADIGTVYRLQALAEDVAKARALCSGLKASGLNCQVKN